MKVPHQASEPRIHPPCQAVEVGTTVGMHLTGGKFHSAFEDFDMEPFSRISNMFSAGHKFVHTLYAYRSVSKTIPPNANTAEAPPNATAAQEKEIMERNDDNNERIMDVLRPEINKLKDTMIFVGSFVIVFKNAIIYLASNDLKGKPVPDQVYRTLVNALGIFIKLDHLKDVKTCYNNDFQRYKQAVNIQSKKLALSENNDIVEQISRLQMFLSHPDPRRAKNLIFLTLQEEIKHVAGHESVMVDLIGYCLEAIDKGAYMKPDEFNMLVISIAYFMLILDGRSDVYNSIDVFQYKKIDVPKIRELFLRYPIIPLYFEVTINLLNVIERSSHFDRVTMSQDWGDLVPDATIAIHNVSAQWSRIKNEFMEFAPKLIMLLHNIENFSFTKSLDVHTIERAKVVYNMTKEGLQYLHKWNSVIIRSMAWKYSHPAPMEHLIEMEADFTAQEFEYDKILKYNFTKTELSMLSDIIGMIKSISGLFDEVKADFASILRFHMHHEIQQLVQGTMLPVLHRMDKRKRGLLPHILMTRQLNADWVDDEEPIEDYKAYSRKMGDITAKHPARVVGPNYLQLQHLRWDVYKLCREDSPARGGNGLLFMGKADLEEEDIRVFSEFYDESFFYPYMIDFSGTLRSVSDISYLWYREIFLENTRCIQFPIDACMPFMMIERVLTSRSESSSHIVHTSYSLPLVENIFYILDIYNDAAYQSLYVLKQQYLYDEIEAEANLVFDQIILRISNDVFSHYKDLAAYSKLDKVYKDQLTLWGLLNMRVNKRQFDIPVAQRCIELLGRTIDLNFIIKQHVNNLFLHDIELAFSRLDAVGITGLTEFALVISIIEETHSMLSEHLTLDPFLSLFKEHNETYDPKATRGFINSFLAKNVMGNLLPNFNYNIFTHRFVKAQMLIKAFESNTEYIPYEDDHFGFGKVCGKAYATFVELTRSNFSKDHLVDIFRVSGSYLDIPYIFDECITFCWNNMLELHEYSAAVRKDISSLEMPKVGTKCEEMFDTLFHKFKEMLLFEDLKTSMFQSFKEIGNAFAFMRMLNDLSVVTDQYKFLAAAPFLASCPTTCVTKLDRRAMTGAQSVIDIDTLTKTCPLGKSFNDVMIAAEEIDGLVKDPLTINNIPELNFRVINSMSRTTEKIYLLHVFIRNVGSCMKELHLDEEWGNEYDQVDHELDFKNTTGEFYRLWSMLNFIFLADDITNHTPACILDGETNLPVNNEDEFGHGFAIAGCLFLHLLEQRKKFDLFDYSRLVANLYEFEKLGTGTQANQNEDEMNELQDSMKSFLSNYTIDKMVQDEMSGLLESCCPHNAIPIGTMRPPDTDYEE